MKRAEQPSRPAGTHLHAQVLIILTMTPFGGRGGVEHVDLAELLRDSVDDPARAEAAAGVAEEIRAEISAARADVLEFRSRLVELVLPYEADLASLPAASEEFDTRMWKHQEQMLQLREELRGHLDADEWREVFDRMREAREPWVQ